MVEVKNEKVEGKRTKKYLLLLVQLFVAIGFMSGFFLIENQLSLYLFSGLARLILAIIIVISVFFMIIKRSISLKKRIVVTIKNTYIAILFCILAILYSYFSTAYVKHQLSEIADKIKIECSNNGVCPNSIEGWKPRPKGDRYLLQSKLGWKVKYPVYYKNNGVSYEFYIYIGPDIGFEVK